MRHGSLFSGMGGFDLAAEWMGWENIFHCEWNPFGQKILKYYWPEAISYADITKTDFSIHRGNIDILTGGFPCQPYSVAGQRKGKDDERHLWPHMLRAIREIKPRWVVGENVLGLVGWNGGLVFEEVQADLEAEGYEVQPYILPAASVNAPHRRDRVWFVGYAKHNGLHAAQSGRNDKESSFETWANEKRQSQGADCLQPGSFTNATNSGFESLRGQENCSDELGAIADSRSGGLEGRSNCNREAKNTTERSNIFESGGRLSEEQFTTYTNDKFIQGRPEAGDSNRFRSWRNKQSKRLYNDPEWANFPTQSPICDGNDGLPSKLDITSVFEGFDKPLTFTKWRNESIKAGGNAIVPHVALQIFKTIEEYENIA